MLRAAVAVETCEFSWPNGDVFLGGFEACSGPEPGPEPDVAEGGRGGETGRERGAGAAGPLDYLLHYLPEGEGLLTTAAGATLKGAFRRGRLHGEVRGTYPSGEEYTGEFVDGQRAGQGTCRYPDGATYKGRWDGDLRQGRGVFILPSGTMFSGEFEAGEFASRGVIIYVDGGSYDGALHGLRSGCDPRPCSSPQPEPCGFFSP